MPALPKRAKPPVEDLALEDSTPFPPKASVYVAFGALSASEVNAVNDELSKTICGRGSSSCDCGIQGDRADGGASYLNSMRVERKVADEIVARLKAQGISGEIKE